MVAYGDGEHYRPKSTYWWLAYNYDNYLASCTLCNQRFKEAKFPIRGRHALPHHVEGWPLILSQGISQITSQQLGVKNSVQLDERLIKAVSLRELVDIGLSGLRRQHVLHRIAAAQA